MLLAQQNIAASNIAMCSHYLSTGFNNDPKGFAAAVLLLLFLFFLGFKQWRPLGTNKGEKMLEPFSGDECYLQDFLWTTGTME